MLELVSFLWEVLGKTQARKIGKTDFKHMYRDFRRDLRQSLCKRCVCVNQSFHFKYYVVNRSVNKVFLNTKNKTVLKSENYLNMCRKPLRSSWLVFLALIFILGLANCYSTGSYTFIHYFLLKIVRRA